jgi:predicted tellurium resistance membrane protein TerC
MQLVPLHLVRALYPHLAGTVELFPDLNYSVSVVLMLVGLDMCAGVLGYDFPPGWLALSMGILFTVGMATSILRGTCKNPAEDALAEFEADGPSDSYGTVDAVSVPLVGSGRGMSA